MSSVKANMAGSIWKILYKVGDQVEAGEDVVILESMKMEIPIQAETSGTITDIKKSEGEFVNDGDVLVEIEDS